MKKWKKRERGGREKEEEKVEVEKEEEEEYGKIKRWMMSIRWIK